MNDEQLLKYSRHLLLNDVGIEGQERILASNVLVIGAGGLGSPAMLYLASAGVGSITVIDDDDVDLTNLQRQIMHTHESVGLAKVESARRAIYAINPDVNVNAVKARAGANWLRDAVRNASVVLDCTDNYATRQMVNLACFEQRRTLISAAATGFDGQISVFDYSENSPCYACLFAPSAPAPDEKCSTMGVWSPLVGIVGSMQASEALKVISQTGQSLVGKLLLINAKYSEYTNIKINKNPKCEVCSS